MRRCGVRGVVVAAVAAMFMVLLVPLLPSGPAGGAEIADPLEAQREGVVRERQVSADLFAVDRVAGIPLNGWLGEDVAAELREGEMVPVEARPLTVELFDGKTRTLEPVEASVNAPTGTSAASPEQPVVTWMGQERDAEGNILFSGVLTYMWVNGRYQVAGTLAGGTERYSLVPANDNSLYLREFDHTKVDYGDEDLPDDDVIIDGEEQGEADAHDAGVVTEDQEAGSELAVPMGSPPGVGATTGPYVDVTIAYTSSLQSPSTELIITNEFNEANLALANTGLIQRLRLEDIEMINFNPTGDVMVTLAQMINDTDGILDGLHSLRDSNRSDMVALVIPEGGGGAARSPSASGTPGTAFTAMSWDHFPQNYMVAHEVGHLMGAEHANEPANTTDPFPYSRGHVVDGVARDVVSGDALCFSGNCPEQLQYSNPGVSFIGNPGVPSGTAQKDVARSYRNMFPMLYEYRGLWGGVENLASSPVSTDPSGNSWGSGHAEGFWKGSSNQLMHKWGPNGWQGPQQIAAGPMASEPEATSWGLGHQEVFWKGADGGLWHVWYANGWSGQNKLANVQMASKPYAIQWGPNFNEVFWKGTDGNVWHMWYNGSWNGPASLGAPCGGGCGFQGDPRPMAWNGGYTTIYVKGNDGLLWRKTYTTSWSAWEQTSSTPMLSDPAPISNGTGKHDIFYFGTNFNLYHVWRDASGWHGPDMIGGSLGWQAGEIRPVTWGVNHIDIYWQASGALNMKRFYGSWRSTKSLATGVVGSPSPVSWGLDHVSVFWRNTSGNLMHTRHQRW